MNNNMTPEGFKMTKLGPLPEEWEVVRLGDVVRTVKGKKPKLLIEKWKENSIPYLTAEYFRKGKISKYIPTSKNSSFIVVNNDDIVFIWDGSNAGDVFEGLNGVLASTMIKIDPNKDKINKKYLFCFLKTKFGLFNSQTTGSTIPHVNKTLFYNLEIPLPPLPEQRKIAAVLSIVQEAKEKTEEVIKAVKELKKSMMKHLFTYGPVSIEEAKKVKFKETKVAFIPEEWNVVNLEDVCSIRKETIDPKKVNNLHYIGLEHIIPYELKIRNWGNSSNIKSTKNVFYEGDILYGKLRPYLNKVAVPEKNGICSTDIMVFEIKRKKINLYYLANYLHSEPFLNYATMTMTGVNHPRTSWAKLRNYLIPLPSQKAQQEIAGAFSKIDKKIEAEEKQKQALEELFKTLLDSLMMGKIRVNNLNIEI